MKFFVAIALIVAVASADFTKPVVTAQLAELQEIVAAINSPSTNPATAAALEQMLLDLLGIEPEPVAVGPAIIEQHPVSVGPAIIDFPVPVETPEAVIDVPATSASPMVQIILNINTVTGEITSNIPLTPGFRPEPVDPVQVIDTPVSPVEVVDITPVSPVEVVDVAPVAIEPVIIGTPVLPSPVVVLPEELN